MIVLGPEVFEVFAERVDHLSILVGGGEIGFVVCVGVRLDAFHFCSWLGLVALVGIRVAESVSLCKRILKFQVHFNTVIFFPSKS